MSKVLLRLALEELVERKKAMDESLSVEYVPHTPTERQALFLSAQNFEALYGGAAGGGKSDALLMGAINMAMEGGRSLVVRRSYADLSLPGAIMARSHEWLQKTPARWKTQDRQWLFPSGGLIQFGYLDTEQDKYRYQGAEFTGLFVDELTQFTESQFLYLISRVRKAKDNPIRIQIRSASNPGGIGHEWVFDRYIANPEDRLFIPATLEDNPHINQEEYRSSLELLDAVTRDQLLHGKWVRDNNGLIYSFMEEKNLIEELPLLNKTYRYICAVDLGASAKAETTAFVVLAYSTISPDALYIIQSFARADMIPSTIAEQLRILDEEFSLDYIIVDAGALGRGYVEEFRRRHGLPARAARKQEKNAYRRLLNGDLERGIVKICKDTNKELIAELKMLTWDDKGKDALFGQAAHLTDAFLYGWREAKHYIAESPQAIPSDPKEYQDYIARKMKIDAIKRAKKALNVKTTGRRRRAYYEDI